MRTTLIVEDDPDIVDMVRDALATEGIFAVGVRDPQQVELLSLSEAEAA